MIFTCLVVCITLLKADLIFGGAVGEGGRGGGVVCVCVRGGGCGDDGGERRWMIANILPACYMQMPSISNIKYKVEGRKIVIT